MTIIQDNKTWNNAYPQYRDGRHRSLKGGGWSVDDWTSGPYDPGQTSRTGVKDTDWKIKVAKQQDAGHAYVRTKWTYNAPYSIRMSGVVDRLGVPYETSMTRTTNFATNQIGGWVDAALYDRAVAKFKRELSGALGNAQALVPVVELRELGGTIKNSVRFASDFLIAFAEARKTRGRSFVSYAQKQWLNFSFGISPMIADTMAILESLENYLSRPKGLHRIHAHATKKWNTQYNSNIGDLGPAFGWYLDQYASMEHVLTYQLDSGIDFTVVAGNTYSLANHLGLEEFGQKLPGVAWELFPFSWVIDYFTTMGAYLEDTYVLPPGSTKYLSKSTSYRCTGYEFPSLRPSTGAFRGHKWVSGQKPGMWEFHRMQREVLSALPHRSLRFKTTDEVGRNAVNKLLNLASILKVGR